MAKENLLKPMLEARRLAFAGSLFLLVQMWQMPIYWLHFRDIQVRNNFTLEAGDRETSKSQGRKIWHEPDWIVYVYGRSIIITRGRAHHLE